MSDAAVAETEMTYADVIRKLVDVNAPAFGNDHAAAVAAVDAEFPAPVEPVTKDGTEIEDDTEIEQPVIPVA